MKSHTIGATHTVTSHAMVVDINANMPSVQLRVVKNLSEFKQESHGRYTYVIVVISGNIKVTCGDKRKAYVLKATGINKSLKIKTLKDESFVVHGISRDAVFVICEYKSL